MARNDRIARLFRVLDHLARSRRGLPLRTLADREGWKVRSLYRDIQALEQAGFPIVHADGRYRLIEGWVPATQLGVDPDELLALHLACEQSAGWRGTRVGESLGRLYRKLAAPPQRSATLVPVGLGEGLSLAASRRDHASNAQKVAVLDRAIRERRVVSAVYESLDGEVTRRAVEPAQLHWDATLETLYLIAFCRLRQALRIFAVHRFKMVSCQKATFARRSGISSAEALRHAFRVWRDDHVASIKLAFTGRAARLLSERTWHPSQRITRRPDHVLFEAEVAGYGEVLPWVLSFGAECVVLAPADLVDLARAAHLDAAAPRKRRMGPQLGR